MASAGAGRKRKAGSRAETPRRKAKRPSGERGRADKPSSRSDDSTTSRAASAGDTLTSALLGMAGAAGRDADDGSTAPITDTITQVMLMMLGSGPAVAAYEGLLSAQTANGAMFHQAVANQQRLNLLGMCTTAKCVRYMFDDDCDEIMDVDNILSDTGEE